MSDADGLPPDLARRVAVADRALEALADADTEPVEIFRRVLVLAKRVGLAWGSAYMPARDAALMVAAAAGKEQQWRSAIKATLLTWQEAYGGGGVLVLWGEEAPPPPDPLPVPATPAEPAPEPEPEAAELAAIEATPVPVPCPAPRAYKVRPLPPDAYAAAEQERLAAGLPPKKFYKAYLRARGADPALWKVLLPPRWWERTS